MKTIINSLAFLFAFTYVSYAQNCKSDLNYKIFENPPDSIPKIFAKGIISLPDRYEYGIDISPNFDELFYTAEGETGLMVMYKLDSGNWTKPVFANLRGNNNRDFEAFYSADGKQLFFSSEIADTSRLWYSTKVHNQWSNPKLIDSPVNNTPVFWATFSNNNTMYYTNLAVFRIFKSIFINNRYSEPTDAGLAFGVHPYISKDESFILFNGDGDIYVAFKDKNDKWSNPVKLEDSVSSAEFEETCPSLSPDNKYLFFSRYNDINEKSDIYWVSADVINEARKTI